MRVGEVDTPMCEPSIPPYNADLPGIVMRVDTGYPRTDARAAMLTV
jgi:hypothetical protein